jgi:hypothetical protein
MKGNTSSFEKRMIKLCYTEVPAVQPVSGTLRQFSHTHVRVMSISFRES